MTVGLFGGSFDPIHHGHLLVAQAVRERLGLDQVRFVPAREQPLKRGQHQASALQRARMVALAIEGAPEFALERAELERPAPSYTVDTLRGLRAREPDRSFALLIGADAARDLPAWREPEALPALARLILFARPGAMPPALPWPVEIVEVPAIDLSATEIRRRVAAGLSIRYWVPDRVADFIHSERLYLPDG
ncbi:MAG TPA: nicotinate-nucleotide adenylyltransferase [Gemmatimonadales bacterium]|nr:nicotinate-nucleotide adenylyltransferase [Gemmatimonadales bacterium]